MSSHCLLLMLVLAVHADGPQEKKEKVDRALAELLAESAAPESGDDAVKAKEGSAENSEEEQNEVQEQSEERRGRGGGGRASQQRKKQTDHDDLRTLIADRKPKSSRSSNSSNNSEERDDTGSDKEGADRDRAASEGQKEE